jgi:hypothetical protein
MFKIRALMLCRRKEGCRAVQEPARGAVGEFVIMKFEPVTKEKA